MTIRRSICATLFLVALATAAGLPGCGTPPDVWKDKKKPHVIVSFPPLYSFAKTVLGEHGHVYCLCTTTGPHHFEYDASHLQNFRQADVFFANGLGLDDKFADKLQEHSHNPHLRYLKIGNQLPDKLLLTMKGHKEEMEGHKEEHGHEHGEHDPHIWMGIPQAKAMVEAIRDELKKVDGDEERGKDYDKHVESYLKVLDKIKETGRNDLKEYKDKKIISFHESLNYFADSFDVKVVANIEAAPGEEPSASWLAELVGLCKKHNVHIIAVEPQYPGSSSANVLMKELKKNNHDVELVVIDPMETAEGKDLKDTWYEDTMRKNLKTLKEAFEKASK
jgi:ABC-type Zn uptake system ZnuABC Zn-binding protein ZnuA